VDHGEATIIGLVLIAFIIYIIRFVPVDVDEAKNTRHKAAQFRSSVPTPLAKGNRGLLNCAVAAANLPTHKRNAQELAADVAGAKRVIATHVVAEKLERCSPECKVHTVIAGMVRDRRALKRLGK
jgi:hypothetical protein